MKNKLLRILFVLLALNVSCKAFIGKKDLKYITNTGFTQGTTYRITYEVKEGNDYHDKIKEYLNEIDRSLSIYNPKSTISRINDNDPEVIAGKYFLKVFKMSENIYSDTDGAFDITVAPLVNAWGFGVSEEGVVADTGEIQEILKIVGMNKVRADKNRIIKEDPRIRFDVNAIAQGYTADVIAEFFDKKEIHNYMIEVGGEVKVKGKNPKHNNWRIGIDKPVDNNYISGMDLQAVIEITDKALATSGNYRKFYIKDGIKYSHTIDPATGFPALSKLLSATVIADDCATADAYATAFMVMGIEKSIEFLNRNDFLEAYLIYSGENGEYKEYMTEGLKEMIEPV
jgi:thiamine biosynthesis lipoprotein